MLVIHWSKHNNTGDILKNGIRPNCYKFHDGTPINVNGVYVFPYTRNKVMRTVWKRYFKRTGIRGNYNGFVFRLEKDDFPLVAGVWDANRNNPQKYTYNSSEEMLHVWGNLISQKAATTEIYIPRKIPNHLFHFFDDIEDFEIIIPRRIDASRIIKVIKDREPKNKKYQRKNKNQCYVD